MPTAANYEKRSNGLRLGKIDVWSFSPTDTRFVDLAKHDDHRQADRLRFDHHRRRLLARRGAVHYILSTYYPTLGSVRVRRAVCPECGEPHGRPEVITDSGQRIAWMSTSATESLAVCAISHSAELGIDLEPLSNAHRLATSARLILSQRELLAIPAGLAPDEFDLAILNFWTLKEAYLKALGVGLRQDPRTVETDGFAHYKFGQPSAGCTVTSNGGWHATSVILPQSSLASLVWRGEAAIEWRSLHDRGPDGDNC